MVFSSIGHSFLHLKAKVESLFCDLLTKWFLSKTEFKYIYREKNSHTYDPRYSEQVFYIYCQFALPYTLRSLPFQKVIFSFLIILFHSQHKCMMDRCLRLIIFSLSLLRNEFSGQLQWQILWCSLHASKPNDCSSMIWVTWRLHFPLEKRISMFFFNHLDQFSASSSLMLTL